MKIIFITFLLLFSFIIKAEETKIANVSDKVFDNYCSMVSLISSTIMTSYQYEYSMDDTKHKLKDIIENQKINKSSKKINTTLVDLMIEDVKEYEIQKNNEEKNKLIEDFKEEIYSICLNDDDKNN